MFEPLAHPLRSLTLSPSQEAFLNSKADGLLCAGKSVRRGACLHELAGDSLELCLCEVLGVTAHSPFGAPKGNVHHGRLPSRQTRQAAP